MGCLCQIFKLTVLIINIAALGAGYVKFYQLFSDIGSTVKDIANTDSFEDLVWIPYLVIQVSSTAGILIAAFCLIRELCEDCYMFNHCFKPCFIITILVYCLAVIPKSILNIVYRGLDGVSLDEWWNRLTDALDGLLGGLAVLGFQVILFMKVIVRVLRSAGACMGSTVVPENQNTDVDAESNQNNGCCIAICCSRKTTNKPNQSDNADTKATDTSGKPPSKPKSLYNRGSNAVQKARTKVKSIQEKVDTKKKAVSTRINNEINTKKTELANVAATKGQKVRNKIITPKPLLCINCEKLESKLENGINDRNAKQTSIETTGRDIDKDTSKHTNQAQRACAKCGQEVKTDIKDRETNSKSDKSTGCCASLLNDRTKCFVIIVVLTNIHMVVYCAELALILCFVC